MRTSAPCESTCTERRAVGRDGDYVTSAPAGEEDPGPEYDGTASCSQIKPTISNTHTRTYTDSCVYVNTEMSEIYIITTATKHWSHFISLFFTSKQQHMITHVMFPHVITSDQNSI
ncbi:hypothetical protein ATANTOWER_017179 [Ataeniobius toweri]|uniref:Uncharacterized protein n=1 Tax=Ataeniobius toweri TaxID=208326 RepID=A0ABU7AG53_9TELE|nr:hypothetical protein [Ataeniobius toweri]